MKFATKTQTLQVPERKDAAQAFAIAPGKVGRPYQSSWDISRAVREALEKSVWAFRAVHAIADNQARLPAVAREGNRFSGPILDGHPIARLLNQRPNPYEDAYSWRYRLSAQILLSKKGAFVEVVGDRQNPEALYLLDPLKTDPIPDPQRFVSGFSLKMPGGRTEVLDPDQVLWLKWPHPTDPYSGLTPLEAAGISLDLDFLSRVWNRTFLQNDGRPGGIVQVDGDIDDPTYELLDDRLNPGMGGVGRVALIEAEGMNYVDLGSNPRDAQHVENRRLAREEILGAFGTPEVVALARATDSTFSNADSEWVAFWISTMLGHGVLIASPFDVLDENEDSYLGWGYDEIEVFRKAKRADAAQALAEYQAGARTLDSYLAATGQDPTDTAEGRTYWQPMGLVPMLQD